jgi:hypothetical protein
MLLVLRFFFEAECIHLLAAFLFLVFGVIVVISRRMMEEGLCILIVATIAIDGWPCLLRPVHRYKINEINL